MPRSRVLPGSPPDQARLYHVAEPQGGYFTTSQAAECGFSRPLLRHYVVTNRFERVAHGIYRLVQFPPGEHEDLVVAWLWSGQEGTFSHETALALHELSDALPSLKHMTVPKSWKRRRVRVPPGLVLHHADLPAKAITWKGSVPLTTPIRTVMDGVSDGVDPGLLEQAIEQGLRRGLFERDHLEDAVDAGRLRPLLPRHARTRKR